MMPLGVEQLLALTAVHSPLAVLADKQSDCSLVVVSMSMMHVAYFMGIVLEILSNFATYAEDALLD